MENDQKVRIFVTEDDVGFRDLLRVHLSLAGYASALAVDGVEGRRALLARPPDLALCDVNLPFMGGFELLSLMRTDERTAPVPAILPTGRDDCDTMAKARERGAADFLTKPVTREVLTKSIHACLAKGGRKAAAELRFA